MSGRIETNMQVRLEQIPMALAAPWFLRMVHHVAPKMALKTASKVASIKKRRFGRTVSP
jgi:hypothetical protein